MKSKNTYILPFRKKDLIITRSDPRAHFAYAKHAIDFVLPEGSEIIAAYEGKVIDLKVDSNEGGVDPKYDDNKYLNYITLEHENGEYTQYCHLKHKSAFVKLEDRVKKGQKIALSGNTGFSSAPHLHFQVFKLNKTKIGWETIEPKFKEKIEIDRKKYTIPKDQQKAIERLEKLKRKIEGKT